MYLWFSRNVACKHYILATGLFQKMKYAGQFKHTELQQWVIINAMGWWNISLGLPCGCSCLRPVLLWTSEQSWSSSLTGLLSIRLYVYILFILLQIVWQPVALENPNSLMSEISTKTQEAEGILVREREELCRITNKIHNVLMNRCQNFQGRKRKWQYDDQYCAILSSNDPIYSGTSSWNQTASRFHTQSLLIRIIF